jgi:hypothetical protein
MGFSLKSIGGGLLGGVTGGALSGGGGGLLGMLGGGGGSPPASPDFQSAAQQQTDANKNAALLSARLSNPNVSGPFGSQNVAIGSDGTPTVNRSLSPEMQQMMQRLNLGSDFNPSNLPAQEINPGQTGQDAIMSRLQPQIERNRSMRETELANQGIMQGSEAWKNAQTDLGQQENDQYTQAALQGITLGNQSRQQAFNEAVTERQLPTSEFMGLLPQAQSGMSGYTGTIVAPPDIMGATNAQGSWNADMYNANQARQSNQMSGLLGLGGTLGMGAMLSDRRAKTDIEQVGVLPSGIPVYVFKYKGDDNIHLGVMADEVEPVVPLAVYYGADGFKRVNYSKVH